MSDPVAEAAAQLAALQSQAPAETPPVEVPNVPAVAEASATAPAIADSGNASAATAQSIPAPDAAAPTSSAALDVPQPAVELPNVGTSVGAATVVPADPAAELPNADASTSPAGDATAAAGDSGNVQGAANLSSAPSTESAASISAGDSPNAASVAVEPTTALGSASNAAGESITSTTGVSSGELPLCMRVATHLEAIYQLVRDEVEAAPAGPDTSALKIRVGDVLFRISNGMAVTEGELVTKLEALYRAL